MRWILFLVLALGLQAQDLPDHQTPKPDLSRWQASVLAVSTASALDVVSSWGLQETNPILGRGTFGWHQTERKAYIVSGSMLIEYLWLRKHPQDQNVFVNINIGATGLVVSVAIHNFSIK